MIVSINQPAYLPWLGYFDRIKRSDLHIVLDHVQFEKGGFTNRTQIRQRDGRVMWLTVPVEKGKPINETKIPGGYDWQSKHRKALWQAYRLSRSDSCVPNGKCVYLQTALYASLRNMLYLFESREDGGWARKFQHPFGKLIYSSHLGGSKFGVKSELVLNLCKEVGATQYLSGPHGRDYLDLPAFDRAGIEVIYHDFPAEQPVLSALDYLYEEATWPQAVLTSVPC